MATTETSLVMDAFARNSEVNRLTIQSLTDDLLNFEDIAGGFSIGQHLADMVGLRYSRLGQVAKAYLEEVEDPIDDDAPTWLRAGTVDGLVADFAACDAALVAAVQDAVRDGRRFAPVYGSHPTAILQHCIVHDSHHRGQIAVLVRRSGRSREERDALENATWAIWRV